MKTNMAVWTLAALGSAALTAAVLVPTAAAAAPDGPALSALTDRDETGATKFVSGKPGELVSPVLGVANLSGAPIKGAAVQIRVIEGLDLPRTFTNCQYFDYSNLEGAWCLFDEELAVDGTYALANFQVSVAPKATRADSVIFRWATPEQVAAGGGIEAMAKKDSRTNEAAPGKQGTVRLEARALPLPATPHPIGFAGVKVTGADPTPTKPTPTKPTTPTSGPTSPPPTATAPPAPPAAGGGGSGDGGGLPVTGSATTTAVGSGIVLLLVGGASFLVARRRRARFEA